MKIERHNFARPNKLAGDLEQRLTAWLNIAIAMARESWSKVLPYELGLALGPLGTTHPAEALARLPELPVAYRVAMPAGFMTLFTAPRPLVLAVIAGLLGDAAGAAPPDRALTVVDESLFQYFLEELLLPALQESWAGATSLALAVERPEPNPQWTKAFGNVESLIAVTFVFQGPFGEHAAQWLVPNKGLLTLLGDAAQPAGQSAQPAAASSAQVKQLMQDVPVEITVQLGTADIPLAQLARLSVGDMVILNQRVAEPLSASIGDDQKYRGWAGRVGSKQAFQIQSLTDLH